MVEKRDHGSLMGSLSSANKLSEEIRELIHQIVEALLFRVRWPCACTIVRDPSW